MIGGTINGPGVMIVLVEATGSTTVVAQIAKVVADAQHRKVAIQALADRISRRFVPSVVAIAILAFGVWMVCGASGTISVSLLDEAGLRDWPLLAFMFGCTVLVIACPCALGLATPTAVMVGCSVGARLGLLIKGGDVLERCAQVSTLVFDKTGTLTTGKLRVSEAVTWCEKEGLSTTELCRIAVHDP